MGKTEEQVRDDWHQYHSMQSGDAAFDNRDIDILRRHHEVAVQKTERGVQVSSSSSSSSSSSTSTTSSPSLVDRPKNLEQGITHGISHFVEGAMEAAGVAYSATQSGRAAGSKHGIAGQVVGMTGGAMVGAIGATAVAVGGVIQGTTAIARGAVAAPPPKRGGGGGTTTTETPQWWNEKEGKWMESNLDLLRRPLEDGSVPVDDSDLLPNVASTTTTTHAEADPGVTVTGSYYHLLGVSRTATAGEIRRQYYLLARQYHPDRVGVGGGGGGGTTAAPEETAERFRAVSEAYQVLSDPTLRSQYDRDGDASSTTHAFDKVPKIDPLLLYSFLFGSDKFQDFVGRLAIATNALMMMEEEEDGEMSPSSSLAAARVLQERRCTRLAILLADRLESWVQNDTEFALAAWISTATDLRETTHGPELVQLIGKTYHDNALFFLGSRDSGIGRPSFSQWKEAQYREIWRRKQARRARMESAEASVRMHQVAAQSAQMDLMEADETVAAALLQVMWTTCVLDITSTLYETCQMVLFDASVSNEVRKQRGLALKALGEVLMTGPPKEEAKEDDMKKRTVQPPTVTAAAGSAGGTNAIDLYEEAAFHAIAESIRRGQQHQGNNHNE